MQGPQPHNKKERGAETDRLRGQDCQVGETRPPRGVLRSGSAPGRRGEGLLVPHRGQQGRPLPGAHPAGPGRAPSNPHRLLNLPLGIYKLIW